MADMLKEAVRLRKLGFAIHWLVPGEKRPISNGWAEAPVMPVEELKKSYRVGYNVGFRPGKWSVCWRRFKSEPPCRLNFEPGLQASLRGPAVDKCSA